MNDIIKLIFFNILLCVSLYYDKRIGILLIILMLIYLITINSSIKNKIVEGFDLYDYFVKIPEFSKYDYSPMLPNSVLYNSEDENYSNVYSFYEGEGYYNTIKNDRIPLIEETNNLLDELINIFESDKSDCIGQFDKLSKCSRECGFGTQEQVYSIIKEKGMYGKNCKFKEGDVVNKPCILRVCNIDEKCRSNDECISGNCDKGVCKRVGNCDKDTLFYCYDGGECTSLNNKYNTSGGRYEWDSRTNTCSFEKSLKTEEKFVSDNIGEIPIKRNKKQPPKPKSKPKPKSDKESKLKSLAKVAGGLGVSYASARATTRKFAKDVAAEDGAEDGALLPEGVGWLGADEAAGAALDATGIGAPIGVALQVGGVVGGVGYAGYEAIKHIF